MDERGGAVDHPGGGDDPQRVERGRGQRHAPHQRQQQRRAGHTDGDTAGHLDGELLDDRPEGAVSLVASSIIPIISAIPTGSFAPDSPFRIVPVRPRISRPPSTENVTAGSVGASAAPSIRS